MRKNRIFLSLAFSCLLFTAEAQDAVYGTDRRPDPAAEKIAVNTAASVRLKDADYCKVSSIAVTPSGRIWMGRVGGGDNADAYVVLSYSDTRGKSWVETAGVIDPHDNTLPEKRSANNPVLWCSPNGDLWLFYTVSMGYFDGRGSLQAAVCRNPDDASPVWDEPAVLGAGICGGRPLVLNNGRWVLPAALWGRDAIGYNLDSYSKAVIDGRSATSPYAEAYRELDSERGSGVYISNDKGTTWRSNLGVVKTPEKVEACYNNPSLIVRNNGELMMLTNSCGTAWCYGSVSRDWGRTWSPASKFILHPDRRISVTRLASGKWLMVRNGRFDRMLYHEADGLYAYLSDDGGATWYGGLCIDGRQDTTDPCVDQAADGTIYVAYNYDLERKCDIRFAVTSEREIDNASALSVAEASQVRTVMTAGRAAASAAADLKRLNAPKKQWASETLRIATYNIQYKNSIWDKRLYALERIFPEYDFDIVGTQEPFLSQIEDMMAFLGDKYDWIGSCISGNNKDRNRHFNPIFYRKDRLELLEWGTEWFSEKPATPGYGAYSARQFVWGHFRDRKTGKEFYHFNSHFDHLGREAKEQSARILVGKAREIANGMPAFFTGDFNSDEASEPYRIIVSSGFIDDTLNAVSDPVNAEYFSMSNYKPMNTVPKNGKHIDHIFFTPANSRALSWQLITSSYDGNFGSDHLPIMVEWKIAN
ncbi:MAG: exo-alpha-sialidase [Alistipes sp.]|nr:exo-alpha-sialidase [Alistipes sp.]